MPPELRPIDWRFLLPMSRLTRVGCSGAPDAIAALREVADDVVPLSRAADCDAAVVVDPAPAHLAVARAAIRPGGVLYVEWSHRKRGAARDLARAGFTDARLYWRYPSRRPRVWVQVDAPGPLYHALVRRIAKRSLQRPLWIMMKALWPALRLVHGLTVLCATARVPGERPDDVAHDWSRWLPDDPAPAAVSLWAPGDSPLNKLLVFPFAPGARSPSAVIKLARGRHSRTTLKAEARSLAQLRSRAPDLRGAPRLLFHRAADDAIGETVLTGRPLYESLTTDQFAGTASSVTDWLIDLGTTTRSTDAPDALLESVHGEFTRRFAAALPPARLAAAAHAIRTMPELASVFEHRDLGPWNLLLDGGRLAVLDWESAEPAGVPMADLTYFLAYAGFELQSARGRGPLNQCYKSLLSPTSRLGAIARGCELRYASALGLPPSAIGPLRAFTWMVHACSSDQRGELTSEEQPLRWSTTEVYLRLWDEAVGAIVQSPSSGTR